MIDKQLPRVLICDPIHEAGLAMLRDSVAFDIAPKLSRLELQMVLPQYDGVIVRGTRITSELLEHAFRLKIIGKALPNLKDIDVAGAKSRGIEVVYAPDANTLAVAEHTMGLLLAMARRLPWAEAELREGTWNQSQLPGTGLAGKTLGIVGFGRIGRQVAIRAQAFGMKVLVNEIVFTPELALEANVKVVDLDQLLALSDFVSLHVTLTPETEYMVGRAELSKMKNSAFLLNTARARLVDENALVDALNSEQISGAALDVLAGEISSTHPLVLHPKVIATPRIAAFTEDAAREATVAVAEQFLDFFESIVVEPILPLRIVPSDRVFPHELIDEKRVNRLAKRLSEAGVLKNPPLVMETEEGYMVLDGATRSTALRQMGLPHMLVQVFTSDTEGLQLNTWSHIIRQLEKEDLLQLLKDLPEIKLIPSDVESVTEAQFEYGSLCTLHFTDGEIFLVQARAGINRLEAQNILTTTYIDAGLIERALTQNIRQLQHEYEDMIALVVFPKYEVEQVIRLAQAGRRLPAGITRFIVPGRVLRINLKLSILKSDLSLRDKNRWLQEYLIDRQREGRIRFYAEPVYLLDE